MMASEHAQAFLKQDEEKGLRDSGTDSKKISECDRWALM